MAALKYGLMLLSLNSSWSDHLSSIKQQQLNQIGEEEFQIDLTKMNAQDSEWAPVANNTYRDPNWFRFMLAVRQSFLISGVCLYHKLLKLSLASDKSASLFKQLQHSMKVWSRAASDSLSVLRTLDPPQTDLEVPKSFDRLWFDKYIKVKHTSYLSFFYTGKIFGD